VLILQRWKMKSQPQVPPAKLDEIAERLEHIEHAIDAMAIETERISEAQRFTTKLLSERTPARSAE
jgi:tetrahydromethanopterin S-methyltransferase subunit G